jgi:hypothetical protein
MCCFSNRNRERFEGELRQIADGINGLIRGVYLSSDRFCSTVVIVLIATGWPRLQRFRTIRFLMRLTSLFTLSS